jgi:hypothetical protein
LKPATCCEPQSTKEFVVKIDGIPVSSFAVVALPPGWPETFVRWRIWLVLIGEHL